MRMLIIEICFILINLSHFSDSLTCYVCNYCNDPFQAASYMAFIYPDHLGYYCRKTSSSFNVTRDASITCVQNGTSGNGQWCCQTDFCNGNTKLLSINCIYLIIILFRIIFEK